MGRFTVEPSAIDDVAEAAQFYDQEKAGLGTIFRHYIKAAFQKIAHQPTLYTIIEAPFRGYFLDKFPYTIYYSETADEVRILAVLHQRRHPSYWKNRL